MIDVPEIRAAIAWIAIPARHGLSEINSAKESSQQSGWYGRLSRIRGGRERPKKVAKPQRPIRFLYLPEMPINALTAAYKKVQE